MQPSELGSACIAARLCLALRSQPECREKRERIFNSFLQKFSSSADDVRELLTFMLCLYDTPSPDLKARTSSPEGSLAVIMHSAGVSAKNELPCPALFTASICEVNAAVGNLLKGSPHALLVPLLKKMTLQDVESLLVPLVMRDRTRICGGSVTARELVSVLGTTSVLPDALEMPEEVALAIHLLCDGSPKAARESMLAECDDLDDGYVSPAAEFAPVAPPPDRKRPREEETMPPDRAPQAHKALPPCRYGAECHRKNPDHYKRYSHPPTLHSVSVADAPPSAHDEPAMPAPDPAPPSPSSEERAVKGVCPLHLMPEHVFVELDSGGSKYKLKYCGFGTYTCTCPVWRYQNKATNERTCKHLQQYLGPEFEAARCSVTMGDGPAVAAAPRAGRVAMPGVLLAQKATPKVAYLGWWLSEKLDGVRAYWDGKCLMSRNGVPFTPPDWFCSSFPRATTLDGELFGGRKKFQWTVGVVKSSPSHPGWKQLSYEVFDCPSEGACPFEDRMNVLAKLFPAESKPAHVHVVEQTLCKGAAHIEAELKRVEDVGGEGLMLREPRSKYVHSRSSTLLKIKSTEELECIVRGYDNGKGKYVGRVGALRVELPNGKQFCVGSGLTDALRAAPPPVGAVISIKCQELTDGGVPRFPVFHCVRFDVDWPPPSKAES